MEYYTLDEDKAEIEKWQHISDYSFIPIMSVDYSVRLTCANPLVSSYKTVYLVHFYAVVRIPIP